MSERICSAVHTSFMFSLVCAKYVFYMFFIPSIIHIVNVKKWFVSCKAFIYLFMREELQELATPVLDKNVLSLLFCFILFCCPFMYGVICRAVHNVFV